jgi:hypothetical protein
MPYELTFTKRVPIADRARYINECCVGGDVIVDRLLPAVKRRYADVRTDQEDWGWFIWFRGAESRLAIDVFTDDPEAGTFRMHLTSRVRRLLFFTAIADTRELDELRDLVESELSGWTDGPLQIAQLDGRYM